MDSTITSNEYLLTDSRRRSQVAALKRIFELWGLDSRFREAYLTDPDRALATTGLEVDPRAVSLMLLGKASGSKGEEPPESLVWYEEFVTKRFSSNSTTRVRNAPENPRFRDWRERQVRRCDREIPLTARYMVHLPVAFELSAGCSVGCPFCALSAGSLEGVFRHTERNAALWRDVLARLHEVVGDAAGGGTCYYATEPLDNPDYELFLADFLDEFGQVPQTTTAAATRDIERTRTLLRWGQKAYPHFDRLSVLSEQDLVVLLDAFSPEELLFTDLLPQFEEAPFYNPTKAGRHLGASNGTQGTIACVSGFVVNMVERSVRLVTPATADKNHPTGELVYEKASFTDPANLEKVVRDMIARHMHETISLANLLGGISGSAK